MTARLRAADLPPLRGVVREGVGLAPLTWLRVGGTADLVVNPADAGDLAGLRRALPAGTPLLPMGVASNLLVRDGRLPGVVVRLGGPLARIQAEGTTVIAGAGALDQTVARAAAKAGIAGLEWLIGIPGTVGGAVRMNAGAFGGETAGRLLWAEVMDGDGGVHRLTPAEIGFSYRESGLGPGLVVLRAAFAGTASDPAPVLARMDAIRAEREASQPVRVATGGSTFKNPEGQKAWRLVDRAGCRGLRLGRATVSEKHCNFLVNTGGATAAEVEGLGEDVRRRVKDATGVTLEWEIVRVGEPVASQVAA
ncbi:MAG: UDP-N-acetylmuramate dehydrogenase [Geminicoccaceae bacterium]|nr:UDP-N-acetylmuramate dehydrogenase [Geminicoccaceae bacterium]